jgi:DNA-binding transcriptional regulator YiaG
VAIAGDPDSLTTGPRLQALRDGFRLTQAELAREMGVVRQRVATIESQAVVPTAAAERYLRALGAIVKRRPEARY